MCDKTVPSLAGHEVTLSTIMDVLSKVKDLKHFTKTVHIPEDLSMKIFNSEATEIVGKVSSFCLETKPSWNHLEEILIKCDEMEAVDTTQLLRMYNRQGRHLTHRHYKLYSSYSISKGLSCVHML